MELPSIVPPPLGQAWPEAMADTGGGSWHGYSTSSVDVDGRTFIRLMMQAVEQ